jgi:ligand-binding sensor domain-containing protein
MERGVVCATAILLAWCPCVSALNPSLDINQYAHRSWTIFEGFFEGRITAIAQTPDGYLWLGTEFGLLRFDGDRNVPWPPPAGERLPSRNIRSLLAARDGHLWIGTREGLASWKDGKLARYAELANQDVQALLEDREGMVWAGGSGKICGIESAGAVQCHGSFGRSISALYEDGGGNLWVGCTTGLWRWKPGPAKLYPMPDTPLGVIEADHGSLLIAMHGGTRKFVAGKAEKYPIPGAGRQFNPGRLLRDRNGSLWVGTNGQGLLHTHQGRTDVLTHGEGLSGDIIEALFEDREGTIWVATNDGLDSFREFAIPTITVKQGLSNAGVFSVLAGRDGSVWIGTDDGLNRWKDGRITIYRKRSSGLPDDVVESLYQDDRGRIWVSTNGGTACFENGRFTPVSGAPSGLMHTIAGDSSGNVWISDERSLLHLVDDRVAGEIPWATLGRTDYAWVSLSDPARGGLWFGFYRGGVAYFKDGQVRASYGAAGGLGEGSVSAFQSDRDGALWAATVGGLSRLKNGRVETLTSQHGLPCDAVHWVMEDDDRSLWLYMDCGLVRIARRELDAWVDHAKGTIEVTVFDSSDGVRSHAGISSYSPRVTRSADGKLWFLPWDGVSVIDPRHLAFNQLPPPVHIEEVKADGKTYWQNITGAASSHLRLPPLVRDLVIDYTACTFIGRRKIRFRYKLEGQDPEWREVVNDREVQVFESGSTPLPLPRHRLQ